MGVKEQGVAKSRARYRVVPRTLIFITHNGAVLLLKGAASKPIWPGLYNGIGGHVEAGETIRQAAMRELEEEAGISHAVNLTLRGIINIETEDPQTGIMVFAFAGEARTRTVRPSVEGTPQWVDWQALEPTAMVPDLPRILPRLLNSTAQHPFTARYWYDKDDQLQIEFDE